jgi:hypothetical protein
MKSIVFVGKEKLKIGTMTFAGCLRFRRSLLCIYKMRVKDKTDMSVGAMKVPRGACYDVRTRDPDVMVVPPTPKSTFKVESLVRAPPTIVSSCEENAALKKWHLPRLCYAS